MPQRSATSTARKYSRTVFRLLEQHHKWFQQSLPLVASENVPSPAVREAIISDFGNRYAEGWPGERVYAGCVYIDQVELLAVELAKKLFKADFADVRPVSGLVANLVVYTAFAQANDVMLTKAIVKGGHVSMGPARVKGTAGNVSRLDVQYFPFDDDNVQIDVDKSKEKIASLVKEGKPPKIAMFGGSLILFREPVRELSDALKEAGAVVCFDAAHVGGLIAGRQFQDPFEEGATVMTMSSHKCLPGPQGGIIVSKAEHADRIKEITFPSTVSNHHLHHVAGKAVAMAETLAFGRAYASQIVRNSKALAQALYEKGLAVVGERRGFTESHQVAVDVSKYGLGGDIEKKLEKANIIVNRQMLFQDVQKGLHYQNPSGIRLGSQELTRLGMREKEMKHVADFLTRVIVKGDSLERVRREVREFRRDFQKVRYAFESSREAYEYIRIR